MMGLTVGVLRRLLLVGAVVVAALVAALSAGSQTTLTITTTSLPAGTVGQSAYSATLAASGGTAPLTWSIQAGALPTGLSLNATTGVISGTPTATASSSITFKVTDSASPTPATDTKALTLTINAAPAIPTASPLPAALVGSSYSQALSASEGTAPLTWSVTSGSLPAGLTLSSSGVVSGIPTSATATPSSFTVTATDAASVASSPKTFSLTAISISPSTLPNATTAIAYSQTLTASPPSATYQWAVTSGALPAGLSLNSSTGAISGTPTGTGTSTFTVNLTDTTASSVNLFRSYSITVAGSLSITTSTLPGGTVGVASSQTLAASGGTAPLTWSLQTGSLPAGLTLNASTGLVSGTPTASASSSITFKVTDAASATATKLLTLTVVAPLSILTSSLTAGTVGKSYVSVLSLSGGSAPLTWSLDSGSLPPGLALSSSSGVLTGTPTTAGTYAFTVKVTDVAPMSATKALSIVIGAAPPSPAPPAPPPVTTVPGRPPCTVCGTAGNDVLRGTPGRDVIYGKGGNDRIYGGGGNDRIYGDTGRDIIYGGAGNDVVYGGMGNDVISGGPGADRLAGAKGADTFYARDHKRDVIDGGPGRDRAQVDRGLDRVRGAERRF